MMLRLYTLLMYLLLPAAFLRLLWRSRRAPAYRERWSERLGKVAQVPKPNGLWIHAVSVGEVLAIAPLVRHLLAEYPQLAITITTTTPTGSAQVQRLFGMDVAHTYMPYDLPPFIRRFLGSIQPRYFLMVETEVWPNLLTACRAQGIHTLLANARLSEKSLRGYQRVENMARRVFALIDQVAAQSDADAERIQQLGVSPKAITVTGSVKFDIDIPASVEEQVEAMRRHWLGRPVWVAASTHEGEDTHVLKAHAAILEQIPEALLILVPRHPERFPSVAGQIQRSGMTLAQRSKDEIVDRQTQVYLGDTMGELTVLLGSADAAFIGGSLVQTGGHNMLEAAAQGVPVCFGPHTFNFAVISKMLLENGAAQRVQNANELAQVMSAWLSDASIRAQVGDAGRQIVLQNRGALGRLQQLLDRLITY